MPASFASIAYLLAAGAGLSLPVRRARAFPERVAARGRDFAGSGSCPDPFLAVEGRCRDRNKRGGGVLRAGSAAT